MLLKDYLPEQYHTLFNEKELNAYLGYIFQVHRSQYEFLVNQGETEIQYESPYDGSLVRNAVGRTPKYTSLEFRAVFEHEKFLFAIGFYSEFVKGFYGEKRLVAVVQQPLPENPEFKVWENDT